MGIGRLTAKLEKKEEKTGLTPFEELLLDYCSGNLAASLEIFGITKLHFALKKVKKEKVLFLRGLLQDLFFRAEVREGEMALCFSKEKEGRLITLDVTSLKQFYRTVEDMAVEALTD